MPPVGLAVRKETGKCIIYSHLRERSTSAKIKYLYKLKTYQFRLTLTIIKMKMLVACMIVFLIIKSDFLAIKAQRLLGKS